MWSATCEQKRDASLDETNLHAVAGNLMGGIWPRRWRWVSFELTSSYKPRKYAISILHVRAPQRRSSDYFSTLLQKVVVAIRFMLPRSVRRVSELMSSSLPDKGPHLVLLPTHWLLSRYHARPTCSFSHTTDDKTGRRQLQELPEIARVGCRGGRRVIVMTPAHSLHPGRSGAVQEHELIQAKG